MTFQDTFNFAKEYPAILNLATFFIGLYFGNKQAIKRDRGKEFNEISEDAFIALNKQIEQLKVGLPGECVSDFLLIYNYVPFYKRWLFRRHIERYEKAQQDLSTYWFYPDLTDTSLRVIIHLEVNDAQTQEIQSGIQTGSCSAFSAI